MSTPQQPNSALPTRRDLIRFGAALGALSATGCRWTPSGGPHTPLPAGSPKPVEPRAELTPKPTICFGCTTHCGVVGWVKDNRVRRITGNPLDPNTGGRICSKAHAMISYTEYPERLLYPLERVGKRGSGKWRRISWDEANRKIGDRLRALRDAGTPEQFVFHYGRDKTKGFTKRFTNAFGTPHRLNRRSICSSNRRAPLMSYYGREFEWESQDLANTKYVLNFGGNPMEAYQGGLYMAWRLTDARVDGGAKLVTFEVRPSATASVSDEYIAIRPGTDGAVALAMAHVICRDELYNEAFWTRWANYPLEKIKQHVAFFTPAWAAEESGVPAETIERLAKEFAAAAPAATTMSNRGSAKHYNGAQSDRAIRLLDVLCGTVGKPGGFCLSSLRGWNKRYGQDGLPQITQPGPKPKGPAPWTPGTREFEALPEDVRERVANFPESWQNKYFGELATPSEYPLSWHWYSMRVGQLVYEYIRQGRQKVGVYMSYTLGASYGYPEAKAAREVLLDEELIPFHVAIDIGYSEHAALADIILPDSTSLERWDAHGTNNYGLRPYIGVRQPLVSPPGQARSIQEILRDLAHTIGGGMEQYFDFEDVEEFYKGWHRNLPMEWSEFKRRGIWTDLARPLDYELYERPVAKEDLEESETDPDTGLIRKNGKAVGIMQDGKAVQGFPTPDRKIGVYDPVFPLAARHVGVPESDPVASPIATWFEVPAFTAMDRSKQLHFTTFKWNVHTQGRSGHWKYAAEIIHDNPLFIAPTTAREHGLEDGALVEVTVSRPRGHTFRAGEEAPVGSFQQRLKVLPGMSEGLVASSHHVGHWQHGPVGSGRPEGTTEADPGFDRVKMADPDIAQNMWWAKSKGGVGSGVHINDAMPIDPAPLIGGQNWFDNVCTVRTIT